MLIYAIIFIVTTLLFFVKNRDCLFINPTVLFCFFQLIMFLGSLRYLDLTLNVDYIHVITMLWAQIAVILGTWIAGFPSRLINNGLATVILLRYSFKKSEKIRFSLRKRVDTYDSKNQYSNASS